MNGLTSDFVGSIRNYNKHNMGKTIGKLHALLIEYEKSLPKKAATPQVMAIQGKGKDKGYISKPKNPKPSAKGHPAKDDTYHHYKEVGHYKRNCPAYLAELIKKKKQQLTPPYTPQLSGVSKRRNHTLLDMVQSMMNLTTLSLSFWDYALESAVRILNMVPTKKRERLTNSNKDLFKCKLIGYPNKTMGYYFYFPPKNKIVARYAEFFEENLISQEVSGRARELEEIQDEDTSPSEITSEIPIEVEGFEPPHEEETPVRRSIRTHRAHEHLSLNVEVEEHSMGDLNEPTSYKVAMLDLESNKWIDAMNAEIQSMLDNMVWVLVDPPPNSRLVAKGYTQLYGVDYEETFSPVTNIRAIRILISIAVYYDYEIYQMDVKTAFLNGDLYEDIYMVQPEGFIDLNHPRRFGFAQNLDEPYVYQKASGSNVTFLILYVDDIIIMGNHIPSLQSVKDYLGKCFDMKDLGEAAFILGIKIYRDRSKRLIRLGQNAYMDKILKRYTMDNSKRGHIPMQERLDLNKTQVASTPKEVKCMQNVPYASAVGSIMYDAQWTGRAPSKVLLQSQLHKLNYIAASEAEMESVWIRKFISGLGIVPTINEPIKMFCDNSAALLFANKPGVQMGARYYHRSNLLKVHTDNNLAYPFTKALPKGNLTQHARSMRLRLASSFM
ncbi:retrotransposon protein, putative, ty1-copia subclass [Tanacetum coccineum]